MLAAIGGALAAGAGSFFGGKSAAKQQKKIAREIGRNQIQWRVEDAKKAGVHPLFALGYQGSVSPWPSEPSPVAAGLETAGAALSGYGAKQERKALADAGLRQTEAETRRINAEADLAELRHSEMLQDRMRDNITQELNALDANQTRVLADRALRPGAHGGASPRGPHVMKKPEVPYSGKDPSTQAGPSRPGFTPMNLGSSEPAFPWYGDPEEAELMQLLMGLAKKAGAFDRKPDERSKKGWANTRRRWRAIFKRYLGE